MKESDLIKPYDYFDEGGNPRTEEIDRRIGFTVSGMIGTSCGCIEK